MSVSKLEFLFEEHREKSISGRYITNHHVKPLLDNLAGSEIDVSVIGNSVLGEDIYAVKLGRGTNRILMWSQMHGNESTTTKAILDFLNTCNSGSDLTNGILISCTILIIPILNPDGAKLYTRANANLIDLNRDAQNLSQPESKILRNVFESFKPNFCFNLHGQRTIFSAGPKPNSATVSFLSPAQDNSCSITDTRKKAMEVIGAMNEMLQELIPGQVGVYDDAFNLNCVGDTFQSEGVPTILFEAGHFNSDYQREITRKYIYFSYLNALEYISKNGVSGDHYSNYFDIPENEKLFFDVIIRNASLEHGGKNPVDIAFQYEERLQDNDVTFIPVIVKIENKLNYFGHKEINAKLGFICSIDDLMLEIGYENVCVKLNNEKIALFSK